MYIPSSGCPYFLGDARLAKRHHKNHQNTWHEIPRTPCERSHTISMNIAVEATSLRTSS